MNGMSLSIRLKCFFLGAKVVASYLNNSKAKLLQDQFKGNVQVRLGCISVKISALRAHACAFTFTVVLCSN